MSSNVLKINKFLNVGVPKPMYGSSCNQGWNDPTKVEKVTDHQPIANFAIPAKLLAGEK
jgi:hypothetical protein